MINSSEKSLLAQTTAIFSVSELSFALKKHVEDRFNHIRVRGEVSGLKRHTSGHMYYTLKDADAVIDAVSWRGSYSNATVALEEGLEVIATGRLTTYPGRSKYQIIVEHFEATGQGALLKLLEDRKKKLAAEGLFALDRKKPIPPYPTTIGVVTSATGAVIRDILHRIRERYPCRVIVWPVLVQGPGAADQIASAINGFNNLADKPDILIVGRGGGSIEDLWAFNEEIVVRAAASSRIPLISAVGHETDTTLIDYAADLRAPTPTGAAELAVPVLMDLMTAIQERQQQLNRSITTQIQQLDLHLKALERGLPDPQHLLDHWQLRLEDWHERLHRSLPVYCERWQGFLNNIAGQIRSPLPLIDNNALVLAGLSENLNRQLQTSYQRHEQLLETTAQRLEQASFTKVLDRGFCLATANGKPITTAEEFPGQHPVTLAFKDKDVTVMRTDYVRPKAKGSAKPVAPTLF